MSSTVTMSILVVVFSGIVIAYVWPRAEARFEKLFVATLGALVGSLIGRVLPILAGWGTSATSRPELSHFRRSIG
jgi:hypothetical protein